MLSRPVASPKMPSPPSRATSDVTSKSPLSMAFCLPSITGSSAQEDVRRVIPPPRISHREEKGVHAVKERDGVRREIEGEEHASCAGREGCVAWSCHVASSYHLACLVSSYDPRGLAV